VVKNNIRVPHTHTHAHTHTLSHRHSHTHTHTHMRAHTGGRKRHTESYGHGKLSDTMRDWWGRANPGMAMYQQFAPAPGYIPQMAAQYHPAQFGSNGFYPGPNNILHAAAAAQTLQGFMPQCAPLKG
jgi:hypothetical protein